MGPTLIDSINLHIIQQLVTAIEKDITDSSGGKEGEEARKQKKKVKNW